MGEDAPFSVEANEIETPALSIAADFFRVKPGNLQVTDRAADIADQSGFPDAGWTANQDVDRHSQWGPPGRYHRR